VNLRAPLYVKLKFEGKPKEHALGKNTAISVWKWQNCLYDSKSKQARSVVVVREASQMLAS
jgi:hypothetical protein